MEYQKAVVAYLDILGFKQLVDNSSDPATILEILRTTTRTTKVSSGVLNIDGSIRALTTTRNFSDLIVRHTEIRPHDKLIERLNIEIHYLVQIQCQLIAGNGIMIRGGVCMGGCHTDNEFIFGPSLNESYRLESEVAVFPRIILDSQLIDFATKEGIVSFVRRGEDASYFVDYLYGGCQYAGKSGFIRPGFENPDALVKAHKTTIEINLNDPKIKGRARQKWLWAGLYHNSVVERLKAAENPVDHSLVIANAKLN
jgi:hypothetical protein